MCIASSSGFGGYILCKVSAKSFACFARFLLLRKINAREEISRIASTCLLSRSCYRTISLRWRCKLCEKAKSVVFAFSVIWKWHPLSLASLASRLTRVDPAFGHRSRGKCAHSPQTPRTAHCAVREKCVCDPQGGAKRTSTFFEEKGGEVMRNGTAAIWRRRPLRSSRLPLSILLSASRRRS